VSCGQTLPPPDESTQDDLRTAQAELDRLDSETGGGPDLDLVLRRQLSKLLVSISRLQNQTLHIIHDEQIPTKRPEPAARQRQRHLIPADAVALVQAYQAGSTVIELADQYGVHRTTVSAWIDRLAIPTRKRGLHTDLLPTVIEQYQAGRSLAKLGEVYGCDSETIRTALKKAGVERRRRRGWNYR
jgi:uncharacterized protein (DUF433 family)